MKTKPLDCKDIVELYEKEFSNNTEWKMFGCCCECYCGEEPYKGSCMKTGKLINNWTYKTCCCMMKEILRMRL